MKSNSIQRKFHLDFKQWIDFFPYLIYQMCFQRFSLSLAGMVQKSSKFMTILNHFFQPSTRKNYPQLYILPAKRGISKCTAVSKQSLRSKVQLCHKYSTTRVSNYSPPYHTWKGIFMKSKSGISHFKSQFLISFSHFCEFIHSEQNMCNEALIVSLWNS